MGLQGTPRKGSGGGSSFGSEGGTRTQSSGEDPGSTGARAGVAPAVTVPTEECVSSGSFAENTMLAPCSEQHSVSAEIAPIYARACPDGGDASPLRSVVAATEIIPASSKPCARGPRRDIISNAFVSSRVYGMAQLQQKG